MFRPSPLHDVIAVNAEAEEIGRNKASSFRLKPDVADDDAVGGRDYPSLPITLAD